MGHPILGDPLYRPRPKFNITVPRCMLHAGELRFAHPITGEAIEIRAPLPPDFQDCARRVLNP
jgi:23S rRNA-/tRNA-specific pseudouridylate synthase